MAKDREFYRNHVSIAESLARSFRNKTPLVSVGEKRFMVTDIVALSIQSKTNMYLVGARGSGKTLLVESVRRSVFNDEGFYLRGDINLQLKDLLQTLNLQGKTVDEIYKISEDIKFKFALIDELNRVPGVLQNQFLNILDGYIEIRGKKYQLGDRDYMLMAATGNPPLNGEYTGVFDEDLALLDRIPLIINTDEIPPEKGDIYAISEGDIDKTGIPRDNLGEAAVKSYVYLKEKMREDSEINAVLSLIKEYVYQRFRYVTLNKSVIDKAQKINWRSAQELKGQHNSGSLVSYCSDISIRTLQSAGRLACAMYMVAELEGEALRQGNSSQESSINELVSSYVASLRLALNYDRRFIPDGLPEDRSKTHAEMISTVFDEVAGEMDPGKLATASVLLMEFSERLRRKDERGMTDITNFAASGKKNNPMLETACAIMDSKGREVTDRMRSDDIQRNLGDE